MAFGPWGDEASASTTFTGTWLSEPSDHESTLITLLIGGVGKQHSTDRAKTALQFVGRTYPVYDVGEARAESISVETVLIGGDENTGILLQRLRDTVGQSRIVLFRDGRGRKMYGMPTDFVVEDLEQGSYKVTFLVNRVDFDEGLPDLPDTPIIPTTNQVQNFLVTVDTPSSSVLLNWDDVVGGTLYTVYLDGVAVIQTETSLGSYGPLAPGNYSMWVSATVAGVQQMASETKTFTIEAQGGTGGGAEHIPANFRAFPQTNNTVNMTWELPVGATGVKLCETRSPDGVPNGVYTGTSCTRGVPTPLTDGPYDFWLVALGPWGTSGRSNHQQFTFPYGGGSVGGGGGTLGANDIHRTVFEEMAYELASTAENSRKDWYATDVYGYIEDIGDNRGYTAGICGFCSGTGDMLEMIQHYIVLKPSGNSMSTYVTALTTLANEGMSASAGTRANALLGTTFKTLWANLAVTDPLFRQAQRDYRESQYWRPAFDQAVSDGVGPLGLCVLYDISINHGHAGGGATTPPWTAQLYVATNGNDANPGTSKAAPKKTIAAAIAAASPGNTISVASGTYAGNVITTKGGTAGNYITVRSETPRGAVIVGNGSTSAQAAVEINNQYIRIQDMSITGPGGEGSGAREGIVINADNVEVKGCHIYNICKWSTAGTGWQGGAGIDFGGPNRANITIDGNEIHNIGTAPGDDTLVHAIYCGVHGTNFKIQNNLLYGCEDFGVHPYDDTEASGIIVVNNTVFGNGRGIRQAPNGITRNNISYNNLSENYQINGTGNVLSNNFSGGTGNVTHSGVTSGVNPQFVRYATDGTGDLRLAVGSPCINAGTATNAPATDYAGTTRPQSSAVDAGAYEYVAIAADDAGSFEDVVATATAASPPPSNGGTQTAYITALINARSDVLTAWGDNPVDGRVAAHRALVSAGVFDLVCPPTISWSMYGDPYSWTSRPDLPAEAARPGGVQPGTPGADGGGDGGGVTLPNPVNALGLGTGDGQLHYNLGMGFTSGHVDIQPAELYAWSGTNVTKLINEGWVFTKLDIDNNIVVSLEAPLDGGRTSTNTEYARCEFREQDEDGIGNISYNPTAGMHYQEGYSRIVSLPPLKPGVCFNQFHDANGDVFMLKTKKSGSKIVVVCDVLGNEAAVIDPDYKVGELIWSRLEVNNSVMKAFYIKGGAKTTTASLTVDNTGKISTTGWYNKYGSYNQSNRTTDPTGRIITEVHGWKQWHTGWPTPVDPSSAAPVVSAGGDATVAPGGVFSRTGTVVGSGITARGWRLVGAGAPNDPNTAALSQNWGSPSAESDEFNYTGAPDSSKWALYDGPGHGNNGLRVPARCSVSNGTLKISGLAGSANTGGMAHSLNRKYGKWEIRARSYYTSSPSNTGTLDPAYHPVAIIWSDNQPWPYNGEYDFLENDHPGEQSAGAFIHYPSLNGTNYQEYPTNYPVDMREFHNYAIEWLSTGIKLYVDGVLWATFAGGANANRKNIQDMDDGGHLTLQLDAFSGSGMNAGTFEIEWVRCYPVTPVGTNPGLSTTDALNWSAPLTPGTYTLEYFATNAAGTTTDQVVVTVSGAGEGTPGNLVYPETFDDGTPYSVFGAGSTVVNVSGSAALTTALANATAGQIITLASGTYTGDFTIANKTGSPASGIVIRAASSLGAVLGSGSSFTINNCQHVTVEGLDAPYDQAGDTLRMIGNSSNCRFNRCRVGPATLTNSANAGNYVYVSDDVQHFRISYCTFRNKGTVGNMVRVYGNSTTQIVCKYGRIDHNLFDTMGTEVANGKECVLYGVSGMSRSDSYAVIERNVFKDIVTEPEILCSKTGHEVQRGNTFLHCAGGATLRHGRNSKQQSNYFVDRNNTTGSGGTKSGGSRFYDSGHLIEDNYYDGLASTSGFQRAIILDTGDVEEPSTALSSHWRVISATVQRNVIVNCTGGIYIGDNYSLAPMNCGVLNNDVINSGGAAVTTITPMVGDSVVSGNTYYASTGAGGYAADGAGIYRKAGRGPKVSYLAAANVGHAADLTEADRTGVGV